MDPQQAITYNNANTNKTVMYCTFVTNNPPIGVSGSFNQLINSGIVHLTGVLIVPFLAPVTGSTLQYGYLHFLEQVNLCEQLSSGDFGVSTGSIQSIEVMIFIYISAEITIDVKTGLVTRHKNSKYIILLYYHHNIIKFF
jgi:hypothetical protein